ncbi:protein tyrosine phosphatase family protein [Rhodanobacter koreensis]
MQIHRLTEQLSVAPQISPEDMAELASAGFRGVINNRPDGEADGQPSSALLAAAAASHGLAYRYLPVVPGQLSSQDAVDFSDALRSLPSPVLAFCRSGTRSCSLWVLQADGDADAVLDTARRAGYDLQSLRPKMLRSGR